MILGRSLQFSPFLFAQIFDRIDIHIDRFHFFQCGCISREVINFLAVDLITDAGFDTIYQGQGIDLGHSQLLDTGDADGIAQGIEV